MHGPAVVGIVAAVAAAIGLRSGLARRPARVRGGRRAARAARARRPRRRGARHRVPPAPRRRRGAARSSAACSASPSPTACRPGIDGTIAPWLLAGAAAAVLIALTAWSAALLAVGSPAHPRRRVARRARARGLVGRRRRRRHSTSPFTHVGAIALAPIAPVDLVGVVVVLALLTVALVRAGHVSLEPALQRARLVQSLRFAATFQDLRAVIMLRHQLAHETPRGPAVVPAPPPARPRSGHLAARLAGRAALAGEPRRRGSRR